MTGDTLRIGTRGSRLALWQAEWVRARIQESNEDLGVDITVIRTQGDKILDVPLAKVGGKGLFVREIEEALLDGLVDVAVHSMKDMPGDMPPGLAIGPVPPREDPRDVLVSRDQRPLAGLRPGARVGTSSLRRAAQLLHARPDLSIVSIRGNLDTRLKKLGEQDMDAVVVAAAGIHRMGLADRITEYLDEAVMVPAVGQGALCIQVREGDAKVHCLLKALDDPVTRETVSGERAFLNRLGGSCQIPVAGHGTLRDGRFRLTGLVSDLQGRTVYRQSLSGARNRIPETGVELAERLLAAGADRILRELLDER